MSTVEEYMKMSKEELQELLKKLKTELEDMEEQRQYMAGAPGFHWPVLEMRMKEYELDELKKRIEACETALRQKEAE